MTYTSLDYKWTTHDLWLEIKKISFTSKRIRIRTIIFLLYIFRNKNKQHHGVLLVNNTLLLLLWY